jgi:hypothetical protein
MTSFPGLTSTQLAVFQQLHHPFAFLCRFPGCANISAGFVTDADRVRHEKSHAPPLLCTHSGCKYTLAFKSVQTLKQHIREYHDAVPRRIPNVRPRHRRDVGGNSRHISDSNRVAAPPSPSVGLSHTSSPPSYTQSQLNTHYSQYQCYPPQPYQIIPDYYFPAVVPQTAQSMTSDYDTTDRITTIRRDASVPPVVPQPAPEPRKSNLMSLLDDDTNPEEPQRNQLREQAPPTRQDFSPSQEDVIVSQLAQRLMDSSNEEVRDKFTRDVQSWSAEKIEDLRRRGIDPLFARFREHALIALTTPIGNNLLVTPQSIVQQPVSQEPASPTTERTINSRIAQRNYRKKIEARLTDRLSPSVVLCRSAQT